MKKIIVTDITLKKLSEEREISLLFREKSAIANCADNIGADAVELEVHSMTLDPSRLKGIPLKEAPNTVATAWFYANYGLG